MGTTTITLKISEQDKERFQEAATRLGISLSRLLKEGAELRADFSPFFMERLQEFSARLRVTESIVIQNLVISWMARKKAEAEVFGKEKSWLKEFLFTGDGPVSGKFLYDHLYTGFLAEFRQRPQVMPGNAQEHDVADALAVAGIDTADKNFALYREKIIPQLEHLLAVIKKENLSDEERELGLKVFGIDMRRQYFK